MTELANATEARIHLQRGHARFKAGRLDGALEDYLAAERLGGLPDGDRFALAALRMRRGEYAEAEALLRALVTRGRAEARFWLGAALEWQGRLIEAASAYEQATRVEESAGEASIRLGILNTQLQRYEEAVAWLERARQQRQETEAVLFYHGWACFQLRRFEACLEAWRLLLDRQPHHARLREQIQKVSYLWGCELIEAGRYDEAIPLRVEYLAGRENDGQLARALAELHPHAAAGDWPDVAAAPDEAPAAVAPPRSSSGAAASLVEMQACLLSGRRPDALRLLREAFRENPEDALLAHSFGLAAYYTARSLEAAGDPALAAIAWQSAIAAWVAAMHNDAFWEAWRLRAQRNYQTGISAGEIAELRKGIETHLLNAFASAANGKSDRTAPESRCERLWQREVKAATALREFGGFPSSLNGSEKKLVCGPLAIELLDRQMEFGRFVAAHRVKTGSGASDFLPLLQQLFGQEPDDFAEDLLEPPRKTRLARYFSQLGVAQALLDLSRPEESLESLAEAACPDCLETARNSRSPGARRISVCAGGCAHFDRFNPGYAGFEDKGERLRAGAIELAVEAHLAIAQAEITAAAPNLASARTHWQAAIELEKESGGEAAGQMQRRIGGMVLGRGQALQRNKKPGAAIKLLEQALDVCGGQELGGQLAECLADRGVAAANEEPRRLEAAVRDLRRAVTLNPHAMHPRINLCLALNAWSGEYYDQGDEVPALALLAEAARRADEGLAFNQHNTQLREQLEETHSALSIVHNSRGIRLRNMEDWPAAIDEFEKALRLRPYNETLQQNLQSAIGSYARKLMEPGSKDEAFRMLGEMLRRFHNDPVVRAEIAKIQLTIGLLEWGS